MIRRYMICIGSHDVFISPVKYSRSGEDDNESQSKTLTLPLQCESSYVLDEESVSTILQDFSHEYLSDVPEDCEIEVQLVVPTRMSIHQREIVIQGVNSMRDGCIRLLGINSSAAALCLAAFGDDERAVAANELLTMSGKRPYCEWDSALKGNQQRRELLSTTEGVLRVLIAEIGKGHVNVSLAEIEVNDCSVLEEDIEMSAEEYTSYKKEQLTIRIMSTCGSCSFGWFSADIQLTAALLGESYAIERKKTHDLTFPVPEKNLSLDSDDLKSRVGAERLPPWPSDLFPKEIPLKYLNIVLPRLSKEITRPFLERRKINIPDFCLNEEESVIKLQRLLWMRNVELESIFVAKAGTLESADDISLEIIERRLDDQDNKNNLFRPTSPSSQLPSFISEQLTWSPVRTETPPKKPMKKADCSKRRNSSGDMYLLTTPSSARTLSGTEINSSVKGSIISPQEGDTPTGKIMDSAYDIEEMYMSPFRKFYRKKIGRQRMARQNMNHIEDLDGGMHLRSLLDHCLKKCLDRADVRVIGCDNGLNSPYKSNAKRKQGGRDKHEGMTHVDIDVGSFDITHGWKSTIEHDDITHPPKVILLHTEKNSTNMRTEKDIHFAIDEKCSIDFPGLYKGLYHSLHLHSDFIETQKSPKHGSIRSISSLNAGLHNNASSEELLTNTCRAEAIRNVVLAQLDDVCLHTGSQVLCAESTVVHGLARVYELPPAIGLRIVPRCAQMSNQRDFPCAVDKTTHSLSHVLWISGLPPQFCFIRNSLTQAEASLMEKKVLKDENESFYEEHIEKYHHPASQILLTDEEDEDDWDEFGYNSCWRERSSLSSCEEVESAAGENMVHVHDMKSKSSEYCAMNAVSQSLLFGGYEDEVHLGLYFHGGCGKQSDTHDSCDFRMSRSSSCDNSVEMPSTTPPDVIWSATETLPEVSLEPKFPRYESEDSYGSYLTEDTFRSSWGMGSLSSGNDCARHFLVNVVGTGRNVVSEKDNNAKTNVSDETDIKSNSKGVATVNCDRQPDIEKIEWYLEILEYIEDPVVVDYNQNIVLTHSLPFPKPLPAMHLESYSLDVALDSMSGIVNCSLQLNEVNTEITVEDQAYDQTSTLTHDGTMRSLLAYCLRSHIIYNVLALVAVTFVVFVCLE